MNAIIIKTVLTDDIEGTYKTKIINIFDVNDIKSICADTVNNFPCLVLELKDGAFASYFDDINTNYVINFA